MDEAPVYQLPKLTQGIWDAIRRYGAVFPKLNWTAPRDAAFMMPQTASGPLHCTSPADVYLLLKSSDLVSHGIDPSRAYEPATSAGPVVPIELVLRKYIPINPSMEFRCFVRHNLLIGVSQRDGNFYRHLQEEDSQDEIAETIRAFCEDEIRGVYAGGLDYIFDVYLTSPTTATLVDFNPYRASTDPLLFSYPELRDILEQALRPPSDDNILERLPIIKVVEQEGQSRGFDYGTNMVPLEMVQMSQGQTPEAFAQAWQQAVQDGLVGNDSDSE